MQRVQLPNGLSIWAPTRQEALLLFREITETETYDRHGIDVRDGDVVLDVGANIGIFTLHTARKASGVRVHAFEPIPSTFAMLERNVAEHLGDVEVVLHPLGVSSRVGTATFEVPKNSFSASMSTHDVDGAVRERGVVQWLRALVEDGVRAGMVSTRRASLVYRLLRFERLATLVLLPAAALERWHARLVTRRVTCGLTTISEVIREQGLERIDLIKIDAEGEEEAVVQGIDDEHWPRIRQLVVEVHDVDGRLDRMAERLRGLGFQVVTEREEWSILELMGVEVLFATRAQSAGR